MIFIERPFQIAITDFDDIFWKAIQIATMLYLTDSDEMAEMTLATLDKEKKKLIK